MRRCPRQALRHLPAHLVLRKAQPVDDAHAAKGRGDAAGELVGLHLKLLQGGHVSDGGGDLPREAVVGEVDLAQLGEALGEAGRDGARQLAPVCGGEGQGRFYEYLCKNGTTIAQKMSPSTVL